MIQLFNAAVGWLPGGVAGVALASCAFFTAFSGASGVTILALGGLMFPMLAHAGYGERFNLGLLTTSGSLGLLFAPSLAILIYGIVASVSIDQLFLAGIVPGLLLMLILAIYCFYTGRLTAVPRHRFSWRRLGTSIREAVWDILLPFGVILGIFGGYVTITEVSACTAIYVLLLEGVIHREINLGKHLFALLKDTAILVGSILIILSVAMGLTNLLIDAQIPMKALDWMKLHVDSQLQFLILLNIFLLLIGCMMDIFSAIVVVVPLILPIALRYGVDPVHLGIIFLANLEIGYSTPPVGINLFIASQRFKRPVLSLFRAALPFLFMMLCWLLLVTYIPFISLWWQ
jgi:tripartite ATP-independent transporter DctM subunit